MTYTAKFIDSNVFLKRWIDPNCAKLIESLDREKHCTSVLVLAEVHHLLTKKNINGVFDYLRSILGTISVFDFTQEDLFNAIKSPDSFDINDKINIEVMKRNNISTIISFDKDFDRVKTIKREEP